MGDDNTFRLVVGITIIIPTLLSIMIATFISLLLLLFTGSAVATVGAFLPGSTTGSWGPFLAAIFISGALFGLSTYGFVKTIKWMKKRD